MAATDERDKAIVNLVLSLQEQDPERDPLDIFIELAERYSLSVDRVQNIFYERGFTLRQHPAKS